MNQQYNLVDVLKTLIRWKIPIAVFVIIAAIASIIVSLMLPNYYASRSVFYPTNPAVTDRAALFSKTATDANMDYFGSKNDVSRFLTVAGSEPILDYIINQYHLVQEYNIDTTDKDWRYKVKKQLRSNYTVVKTENGAIEISYMDKDPQQAAKVVNDIVDKVDNMNKQLMINNKHKVLVTFREKQKEMQTEVQQLSDSLAELVAKYHVTELPTTATGEPIVKSDNALSTEQYKILRSRRQAAMMDLNDITTLLGQHEASTMENVSTIYVVEEALPSDRKSWPIRWLIVVGTTLVALFLGIVGALLVESFRDIKAQLDA